MFGVEGKVIMRNPKGYLSPAQIEAIIARAKRPRDELLMLLLWRTGARVTETLEIQLEDFYWGDHEVLIKTLKRKGDSKNIKRPIALAPDAEKRIKELLKQTGIKNGYIFPSYGKARRMTRQMAHHIIAQAAKDAGIRVAASEPMHPHIFRHSMAMFFRNSGVKVEELQRILGHTDISSTGYYFRIGDTDVKDRTLSVWKKYDTSKKDAIDV